jgi:hypothetical protein
MANAKDECRVTDAAVVDSAPQTLEAPADVEEAPAAAVSSAPHSFTNAVATPAAANAVATVVHSPALESSETLEVNDKEVSQISAAIDRATRAFEEMQAKVREYDTQCKASETAAAYLGSSMQTTHKAFDDLAAAAKSLKDRTVEIPAKVLRQSLKAANQALEQMTELANKYDEKFQVASRVRKAVSVPQERCKTALAEASSLAASASTAATAQLQDVSQGILSQAAALANSSASFVFCTAAALDNRFNIEGKALSAGNAVLGKAQQLDERYRLKENVCPLACKSLERARVLDSKATGGRMTPMLLSAVDTGALLAMLGISYAQNGYETAKNQRQAKEANSAKTDAAETEHCRGVGSTSPSNCDDAHKESAVEAM